MDRKHIETASSAGIEEAIKGLPVTVAGYCATPPTPLREQSRSRHSVPAQAQQSWKSSPPQPSRLLRWRLSKVETGRPDMFIRSTVGTPSKSVLRAAFSHSSTRQLAQGAGHGSS